MTVNTLLSPVPKAGRPKPTTMPERTEPDEAVTPGTVRVVGSVNIDHTVRAERFPQPGETILGDSVGLGLGGKGVNQAVASALAGAPTSMAAAVGGDDEGRYAKRRLGERGVDVSELRAVAEQPTGTAWITVTPADNTIIVVPGANACWPEQTLGALPPAGVTLAQLEIPLPAVLAAARRSDGLFLLNAAPAMNLPLELLSCCDVLVVNEHELRMVGDGLPRQDPSPSSAGSTPAAEESTPASEGSSSAGSSSSTGEQTGDGIPAAVEQTHRRLLAVGVGAVVTTLGERGAVLSDAHGSRRLAAIPASKVVDTTGAGDAFTGTLAARLALGDPMPEAVVWAMAAGSLAVGRPGAQESYADAQELAAMVARHRGDPSGSVTRTGPEPGRRAPGEPPASTTEE